MEIDKALERMERLFPEGQYQLTLVCRYVGAKPLDANLVLTRDDFEAVIAAIRKETQREPLFRAGDPAR